MTTINLTCTGASVQADAVGELTAGMTGIVVNIDFDAAWEGLTPTFYAGNTTDKAVPMAIDAGGLTKIPPEVMVSGKELLIGARGVNAAGDIVLPTRWACVGMIDSSPDDAEKVAPKPPVTPDIVDQIKAQAYAASVNAAESKEAAEAAQLSAGESAASAAESAEAANRAAGEASGAKQAANEAGQKAATAEGKADTALSIASGASRAFTAETFQELQAWLRDPANAGKLMRGDNLYIVALDTPDYWVVSPLPSADPETGYYYRISPLETSKVDLSGYAKLSQLSAVATSGDYSDLKNKPTIPADQSKKIEELEKASTALKEGYTQLAEGQPGTITGQLKDDLSDQNRRISEILKKDGGGSAEADLKEIATLTHMRLGGNGTPYVNADWDAYIISVADITALTYVKAYSLSTYRLIGFWADAEVFDASTFLSDIKLTRDAYNVAENIEIPDGAKTVIVFNYNKVEDLSAIRGIVDAPGAESGRLVEVEKKVYSLAPTEITVCSYNVGHFSNGVGTNPSDEALAIAQMRNVINTYDPHILFLQENLTRLNDSIYPQVYEYNADVLTNNVAIKSKFELASVGNHVFATGRNCTYASVRIGGKDIWIASVHFSTASKEARLTEYAELLDILAGKEYFIVCGDFNAGVNSSDGEQAEFNILIDNGYNVANGGYIGLVGTTVGGVRKLDNIVSNLPITSIKSPNTDDAMQSDHRPILSKITINGLS